MSAQGNLAGPRQERRGVLGWPRTRLLCGVFWESVCAHMVLSGINTLTCPHPTPPNFSPSEGWVSGLPLPFVFLLLPQERKASRCRAGTGPGWMTFQQSWRICSYLWLGDTFQGFQVKKPSPRMWSKNSALCTFSHLTGNALKEHLTWEGPVTKNRAHLGHRNEFEFRICF